MSSLTRITSDFLRQMKLPHPGEGDKKARGNVLVIAGGAEVPGSALLAGIGALRAGAGRLQIAREVGRERMGLADFQYGKIWTPQGRLTNFGSAARFKSAHSEQIDFLKLKSHQPLQESICSSALI